MEKIIEYEVEREIEKPIYVEKVIEIPVEKVVENEYEVYNDVV